MKNKTDFFKVNLIYFMLLVVFVVVRIVANANLLSFLGDFNSYTLNFIIQIVAMFGFPILFYSLFKKQKIKKTFDDFSYKKVSFKAIIYSIILGVCVFIINIFISTLFSAFLSSIGYAPNTATTTYESYPIWLFIVTILFTAVLPGICEETAHRGMLLAGYKKLGAKKAILLSALLFGLMHLNIEQSFYAFVIGILLGYLTVYTGSIIPSMIVHFMNNAISVYLTFAFYNNLWLGDFYTKINTIITENFITAFFLFFTVLVIAVIVLSICIYLLIKETRVKHIKKLTSELAKNELRNSLMQGVDGYVPTEDSGAKIVVTPLPNSPTGFAVQMEVYNDKLFYPTKQLEKPTFNENIFFYANLFLTIAVTVSTFIWGIL